MYEIMIESIFSIDDYYHVSRYNEQLYDIDENHLLLHLFHCLLMAIRKNMIISFVQRHGTCRTVCGNGIGKSSVIRHKPLVIE
jgi:hypothetical protein